MEANEKQFSQILDAYKDVIVRVCYSFTSADSPFDDLYQEVLINIWKGLERFRGESQLSTWIYRTAINTCITWQRRNGRHGVSDTVKIEDLLVHPADKGAYDPEKTDQVRFLYSLIEKLGPIDKAIVTMWLDDLPVDDISAVTGLTINNVRVRIHRIKKQLAAKMD